MQLHCFVFGIIFLVCGFLFFSGRAIPKLKGWKILSSKEQETIRVKALGRNVGIMLWLPGVTFELAAFSSSFQEKLFIWCMIGWMILVGLDAYVIEKSKRYIVNQGFNEE